MCRWVASTLGPIARCDGRVLSSADGAQAAAKFWKNQFSPPAFLVYINGKATFFKGDPSEFSLVRFVAKVGPAGAHCVTPCRRWRTV